MDGFFNLTNNKDHEILNRITKIGRNHVATYSQEFKLTCWPKDQLNFHSEDFLHVENILQDYLDNIGKNSKADKIELSVEADDKYYILRVKDNYKNPGNVDDSENCICMKDIHKRTKNINTFIISSFDKNNNLTLRIPQKKTS